MADRFPNQTPETIGQFGVVSSPRGDVAQQRTGVLRFRDNVVELEVSPGFSSVVSWTKTGPGTHDGRPSDDRVPDDSVVLGVIAGQPGEVTLWGVHTVALRSFGFPRPDKEELSREVLAADWCLVGEHFPSDATEFSIVTLDMTGMHQFADLPSIRVEC